MKLLIVTQAIDKHDPILGFFHRWVEEFAKHADEIIVICLKEGTHSLPANVRVFSLGKEHTQSKVRYLTRFYTHIWRERKNYNSVFVHMNQEYILLGGIFWKLWKKQIYLWRNHHAGSWLTDVAAAFCKKVFCTSKYSYTTKYKKTECMPVGIDLKFFKPVVSIVREPHSILFLARMSPAKKPHIFIDSLSKLHEHENSFIASLYGDPRSEHRTYYNKLREQVCNTKLSSKVVFCPAVSHAETLHVYNKHTIFVNTSSSGMYDKTIFEAMACGCLVLVSNENLRGIIPEKFLFKEGDVSMLASKLEELLSLSEDVIKEYAQQLRMVVSRDHSLTLLGIRLFDAMR